MDVMASLKDGNGLVPSAQPAPPLRARVADLVLAAVARVEQWRDRTYQRRLLAQLPERELRDVGLSRYDALHEWRKPFWRD